jgi:hypothetical protein
MRNELLDEGKLNSVIRLAEHLFSRPVVTATSAASLLGVTRPTAHSAIDILVDRHDLHEVTGRERGRIYEASRIFDAFYGPVDIGDTEPDPQLTLHADQRSQRQARQDTHRQRPAQHRAASSPCSQQGQRSESAGPETRRPPRRSECVPRSSPVAPTQDPDQGIHGDPTTHRRSTACPIRSGTPEFRDDLESNAGSNGPGRLRPVANPVEHVAAGQGHLPDGPGRLRTVRNREREGSGIPKTPSSHRVLAATVAATGGVRDRSSRPGMVGATIVDEPFTRTQAPWPAPTRTAPLAAACPSRARCSKTASRLLA